MKLVVTYAVGDSACGYATVHQPVEYESAEKLLIDLEEGWKKWRSMMWSKQKPEDWTYDAHLENTVLQFHQFASEDPGERVFEAPKVRILEEWFSEELNPS